MSFDRRSIAVLTTVLVIAIATSLHACKSAGQRAPSLEQGAATPPTADAGPAVTPSPTYSNRIADILDTHCTKCHARGGIGPMPLTSFTDAHEHAARIVEQTRERRMPPWLPDTKGCAPLEHSRALDEADISALARWQASGAPEGDPGQRRATPPRRTFQDVIGPADRVAAPDLAYAPKRGGRTDDYHCFVIDPKLEKPERVVALRIAPGRRRSCTTSSSSKCGRARWTASASSTTRSRAPATRASAASGSRRR